jgi:hypothetical protein
MPNRTPVLLIDDGELDDVRRILQELGAEFAHLRGGAVPGKVSPPERLLVTTPRRALLVKGWPARTPTKVVIVNEDSNTLRGMLRRMGFDLLVRRPVHPHALRLVLLRALYEGEEKRREERVPLGVEVSYRSGFRRKSATLADISSRGCLLLSEKPLAENAGITIYLPKELGGNPLSLRGRVVRGAEGPGAKGCHAVAVRFEPKKRDVEQALHALLQARKSGNVPLGGMGIGGTGVGVPDAEGTAAPVAAPAAAPVAAPATPEDRRKHQRARYAKEVITFGDEAGSVLLGRDISIGGMRVAPDPRLSVGVSLRLALYGGPREDPFIVRAAVVRADASGVALQFQHLAPEVGQRLEALVARLPAVESLAEGESEAIGGVVSRILEEG